MKVVDFQKRVWVIGWDSFHCSIFSTISTTFKLVSCTTVTKSKVVLAGNQVKSVPWNDVVLGIWRYREDMGPDLHRNHQFFPGIWTSRINLRYFYKLQLKIVKNVSYDIEMDFGMDQWKPIQHWLTVGHWAILWAWYHLPLRISELSIENQVLKLQWMKKFIYRC